MTKPKGKTPSLLGVLTGTPKATLSHYQKPHPCFRCKENIPVKGECISIQKKAAHGSFEKLFCYSCTKNIIEQTTKELIQIEKNLF